MSPAVPWTVVSHTADDSVPAITVTHLMSWLDREPSVELHTVLWSKGHNGPGPYDFGRLADVSGDHDAVLPDLLRRVGLGRLGGGLAGRAVRSTLRSLPDRGVLYLSSAASGAVLRYLPPGRRTVVTHLHATDRDADPPVSVEKRDQLRAATDVWLAVDEPTRDWAAATFGIDPAGVAVVPEPVDPSGWNRATKRPDPRLLRLGLRGAAWFGADHGARLVQRLRRLRPDLHLDLVWAEVIGSPDHLAPLRHDLERLGMAHHLELPRSSEEVVAALDAIDVMVLTTPDDEAPWSVHDAMARGVPVVCFDTHRLAPTIDDTLGLVVDYPDVVAMADAVLTLHADGAAADAPAVVRRRAELHRRDVAVVGAHIMQLAGAVR